MAELRDLTKQLQKQGDAQQRAQDETTREIIAMRKVLDDYIQMLKRNRLDDLEARREKAKEKSAPQTTSSGQQKGQPSRGGLGLPFLGKAALGALTALFAELTGLDALLRGLRLIEIGKSIKNALDSFNGKITKFLDGIKKFKADKLDEAGKLLNSITGKLDDVAKTFKKLGNVFELPQKTIDVIDDLALRFMIFRDDKLIPSLTSKMDLLKTNITGMVDEALKALTVRLPEIKVPKVSMPEIDFKLPAIGNTAVVEGASNIVDGIGSFFKKIVDTMSTIGSYLPKVNLSVVGDILGSATSGLLGFFTTIIDLIKPVAEPVAKVLKGVVGFALRPFIQVFLTIFDFVKGAFEGWTQSDADSFSGKAKDALEGGVIGIFKGFTEAIDLLINFGGFIADKFGLDGVAKLMKDFSLTDMVEPAYNAVKKFIKDLFTGEINPFKTLFSKIGEMLPSVDTIKSMVYSFLPSFLQPASIDEQRKKIQGQMSKFDDKIKKEQERIKRSNAGKNEYWGDEESGRADSMEDIKYYQLQKKALQEELDMLPQMRRGGIINAAQSGTLAMLHGQEMVVPLNSPQGKVMKVINEAVSGAALANSYDRMQMAGNRGGSPAIVDASVKTSSSNTTVLNTTFTPVIDRSDRVVPI